LKLIVAIIILAPLSKADIIIDMLFLGGWVQRREFIELLGCAGALSLEVLPTLLTRAAEIFE